MLFTPDTLVVIQSVFLCMFRASQQMQEILATCCWQHQELQALSLFEASAAEYQLLYNFRLQIGKQKLALLH